MAFFLSYCRAKGRALLLFLAFSVLFAVSFALYRLPLGAALYPTGLCVLLGVAYLAGDLRRAYRRHRLFQTLLEDTDALTGALPEASCPEAADYRALVEALRSRMETLRAENDAELRSMTEYYTAWAHQIKTPIAAMRLLLQGEDTPASRQLLGELFRVEQYVEMVMTYLRLDAKDSDYVFRRYRLDDILRPCIRRFASVFISRGIRLEYTPIDQEIVTDEKWLAFVVEQLLSNALKYTPQGTITLTMTGPETLTLRDTGIGIAPEDLPRVFQQGYTGYNGRTDKRATGLGLYLCSRICRNLGIGLSIDSQPGRGTAVTLELSQKRVEGD